MDKTLDLWPLALATFLACFLTLLLKTLPITFLQGGKFPALLRKWLDYIPVAVMAALVGPDIFIVNGKIDLSTDNLFLLVSIPVAAVAWFGKNYFITIAVGIGLVILARFLELA